MLDFIVYGKPQPQGSKTAYRLPNGRTVLTEAVKGTKPWRSLVRAQAIAAYDGKDPSLKPIKVVVTFHFERPKSVTREAMTVKPDCDKLARNVLDACTGVIYKDDSQVVELVARKVYGPEAMAVISVIEL
jgi:crossover junction endodeoxyribonuclease RusA